MVQKLKRCLIKLLIVQYLLNNKYRLKEKGNKMKNYYFKMDRIDYQNKILDTLDNALNDLKPEEFDVLIQRIQEYIDDLN